MAVAAGDSRMFAIERKGGGIMVEFYGPPALFKMAALASVDRYKLVNLSPVRIFVADKTSQGWENEFVLIAADRSRI